jgi:hypothetical protein
VGEAKAPEALISLRFLSDQPTRASLVISSRKPKNVFQNGVALSLEASAEQQSTSGFRFLQNNKDVFVLGR